jgi:hypothetical protein
MLEYWNNGFWDRGMMGLRKYRIKANIIKKCRFNINLNKMVFSAFHTQYSSIPLFHNSRWLSEENGHQKNYNSNNL